MPIAHYLLALLVVVVWGFNFLFVKFGLEEISPLLLCSLRFFLASFPIILFIKPPTGMAFRMVVYYGLVMFAFQFGFLFMGMNAGMTPGMASLIMQVQIFFSLFFAALFLGERPSRWEIAGALVSFMGIALIGLHVEQGLSLLGFILILGAAASWGFGNLITKKSKTKNMFALVIWGSFIAFMPMLLLSFIVEGPASIIQTYHHLTWKGAGSLAYIVYASTLLGYGVWNWLLSRYPVRAIVPMTLLVPVVGVLSSVILLGEPFQLWKLVAGLLVVSGLCINILSTYLLSLRLAKAV